MGMPTDLGIVDLGMGFPYQSVEQKMRAYDFFRANLKDKESLQEMEFPAQYMFKQVPDVVPPDVDPVHYIVEKMDAFGIDLAKVGLSENGIRAKQLYPDRFFLSMSVNPHEGVEEADYMVDPQVQVKIFDALPAVRISEAYHVRGINMEILGQPRHHPIPVREGGDARP